MSKYSKLPSLIGMHVNEARKIILEVYPTHSVEILTPKGCVTKDLNDFRIRITVDKNIVVDGPWFG